MEIGQLDSIPKKPIRKTEIKACEIEAHPFLLTTRPLETPQTFQQSGTSPVVDIAIKTWVLLMGWFGGLLHFTAKAGF